MVSCGVSWVTRIQTGCCSAEKFAVALEVAAGDLSRVDAPAKAEFLRQFPDLDLHEVTLKQVHSLRRQFLDKAVRTYHRGFERSGDSISRLLLDDTHP